jgi:Flp pilus assembly protein TadG
VSRHRGSQGQATVELALCLPLLCVLVMAVLQVAVVVGDVLAVQLAAREAARAATMAADPGPAAAAAAEAVTRLPLEVAVTLTDDAVTAEVRASAVTDVPLIGWAVPDVGVSARVTMRREPP